MVIHALHQVSHKLRVKERHRELELLYEKVADKRYVDAEGYV